MRFWSHTKRAAGIGLPCQFILCQLGRTRAFDTCKNGVSLWRSQEGAHPVWFLELHALRVNAVWLRDVALWHGLRPSDKFYVHTPPSLPSHQDAPHTHVLHLTHLVHAVVTAGSLSTSLPSASSKTTEFTSLISSRVAARTSVGGRVVSCICRGAHRGHSQGHIGCVSCPRPPGGV